MAQCAMHRLSASMEVKLIVMSLSPRYDLTIGVLVQGLTPGRYFASRWYSLRHTRVTRRPYVSTRTSSTVRLRPTRTLAPFLPSTHVRGAARAEAPP
jgi:hypothetical protein